MKIDLRKLYGISKLDIDEDIKLDKSIYSNMNIRDIIDLHINGLISVNYENNIELDLTVNGIFIMPCEITGEDVLVPFKTKIEDEILENTLNDNFYLDLSDILWENIVLEVPFKVVKEGAKIEATKGDGWCLSSEEA